jgi:hypothetical protein
MNLSQTCSSYSLSIELAEHIFNLALEVILIDNLDLLIWELRAPILEYFQHLDILFRSYSLKGTDILPSFKVYPTARC